MNNLQLIIANKFDIDLSIIKKVFERLTDEEIKIIQMNYTNKNLDYDTMIKYYGDIVPKIRMLTQEEIKKTNLIDYTYRKIDSDFITLDEYVAIIKKIRNGYYIKLAEVLKPGELMVVLMKIVNVGRKNLSNDDISDLLSITPDEVNKTMKKVFKSCKKELRNDYKYF